RKMKKLILVFLLPLLIFSCKTDSPDANKTDSPDANTGQALGYDVEEKLEELGIELVVPNAPTANYLKSKRSGNLIFLSGHGPDKPDGTQVHGQLGGDLTLEQGQEAARYVGISLLASLKAEIGDLNKVKSIVKALGMVNADPSFTNHSQVINGFSDLMVEVFGERGKHARSAVGMSSLPSNIAVEIELIVEIEE